MKNIEIINGNNKVIIPVETEEISKEITNGILDVLGKRVDSLGIYSPNEYTIYTYGFLSNSVIKFPKFD